MNLGPRLPIYRISAALLLVCLLSNARAQQRVWTSTQQGPIGKDLNAVFFVDSKRGWIAGDGGFLSVTADGGQSWTSQKVGTTDPISDVYFRSKEEGYLLSSNRIFATDDGGVTWREVRRFAGADYGGQPDLYSVRFANKKRGWIVGSVSRRNQIIDSLVLYTDDGGESWQRQRVPVREELIHLDFTSDERGWVVGAAGTILHTKDAGQSWVRQKSDVAATLYNVDFRNKEKGWAVGERGTILRTTDGGERWELIPGPIQSTLLSVKFLNDDDGWAIGRGGVILRSGDGGRTWLRQESRTEQNLYALYVDKKAGWAAGGDGILLRYEL